LTIYETDELTGTVKSGCKDAEKVFHDIQIDKIYQKQVKNKKGEI
jgi:hypothetical protein